VADSPALSIEDLDPRQRDAVAAICTAAIAIVTGGPGTGKTSCLRAALDALDVEWSTSGRPGFADRPYALCAPTGKAAKRIEESTGRSATTIHRLLAYKPGLGFTYNRHNPLGCAVVIVDEASMLDIELAAALLRALSAHTRLILVGDVNQLPPVGPGQPFADLVAGGQVPTVRLQTLHRSAAHAWISSSAPLVLEGQMPPLETRTDFDYVRVRSVATVLQSVRRVMEPADMQAQCQVLIPMREGNAGTTQANIVLQAVCNSEPLEAGELTITRDKHVIRRGDRVIQTRNNYDLGVFNGEIGQVEEITTADVIVQFADARAAYQRSRGDDQALELAYALTVHKSQGSEFPWVLVVVHSTHTIMLNRRLFYTAITRAKQGVVLVGDDAGIERALGTGFTRTRMTTLNERIAGTLEPIVEPPSAERTERDAT
jgi:exodeoxyribonuclease V alpha subunit